MGGFSGSGVSALGLRTSGPGAPVAVGAWFLAGTPLLGSSDLAQIAPLVWVLLGIGSAGAIVTFAALAYSLWRFRDPATRRRRFG